MWKWSSVVGLRIVVAPSRLSTDRTEMLRRELHRVRRSRLSWKRGLLDGELR